MGSDCVEAINAISGERCSPHPHNFTDRLIRPGDQAFFDIIQSFMAIAPATTAPSMSAARRQRSRTPTSKAREWIDSDHRCSSRGSARQVRVAGPRPRKSASRARWRRSASISPRAGPRAARAADDLAAQLSSTSRRDQGRHGVRASRPFARRTTAISAARIEEEVVLHARRRKRSFRSIPRRSAHSHDPVLTAVRGGMRTPT